MGFRTIVKYWQFRNYMLLLKSEVNAIFTLSDTHICDWQDSDISVSDAVLRSSVLKHYTILWLMLKLERLLWQQATRALCFIYTDNGYITWWCQHNWNISRWSFTECTQPLKRLLSVMKLWTASNIIQLFSRSRFGSPKSRTLTLKSLKLFTTCINLSRWVETHYQSFHHCKVFLCCSVKRRHIYFGSTLRDH